MVFFKLFCVFCVFAQGFSLKVQLLDQNIEKVTIFIRFFDIKVLKTFILDTFASENAIKPMDFQFFCDVCIFT